MKYLVILAVIIISGLYLYNLSDGTSTNDTQTLSELEQAGEKCLSIRDRATANIVPIIEFQRMELESRRANVFSRCMEDHGFSENPAWLKYASPLARKNSASSNISFDEAVENLRRSEMLIFTSVTSHPLYWDATPSEKTAAPSQ